MRYNADALSKKIEKNKKIKKIISNVVYSILAIFFVVNIIILIQNIANPKKVPNIFGYKSFSIVSRKYGSNDYGE